MTSGPSDSINGLWAHSLEALRCYRERCETANVPRRVRAYGIDLGKWVAHCRDTYWDGHLGAEQIQALEDVDGWDWGPERPGSWRHTYDALKAYAQTHGTTMVVETPASEDVDLQAWAAAQRKAYADRHLSRPQIEMLRELPDWHWDPEQTRWRQGILAAKTYTQRYGSLEQVQRDTRLGAYPLGQRLHRCREGYRAGTLSTHRITELERLPGWKWGRYQTIGPRASKPTGGMSPRPAMPHRARTPSSTATPSAGGSPRNAANTGKEHYRPNGPKRSKRCPVGSGHPSIINGNRTCRHSSNLSTATATRIRRVRSGSMATQSGIGFARNEMHKRGRLPPERATELESLPGWHW